MSHGNAFPSYLTPGSNLVELVRVRELLSWVGISIDNSDPVMARQINRIDDMLRPPERAKVVPLVPWRR
jgi:hypothetical protein